MEVFTQWREMMHVESDYDAEDKHGQSLDSETHMLSPVCNENCRIHNSRGRGGLDGDDSSLLCAFLVV